MCCASEHVQCVILSPPITVTSLYGWALAGCTACKVVFKRAWHMFLLSKQSSSSHELSTTLVSGGAFEAEADLLLVSQPSPWEEGKHRRSQGHLCPPKTKIAGGSQPSQGSGHFAQESSQLLHALAEQLRQPYPPLPRP